MHAAGCDLAQKPPFCGRPLAAEEEAAAMRFLLETIEEHRSRYDSHEVEEEEMALASLPMSAPERPYLRVRRDEKRCLARLHEAAKDLAKEAGVDLSLGSGSLQPSGHETPSGQASKAGTASPTQNPGPDGTEATPRGRAEAAAMAAAAESASDDAASQAGAQPPRGRAEAAAMAAAAELASDDAASQAGAEPPRGRAEAAAMATAAELASDDAASQAGAEPPRSRAEAAAMAIEASEWADGGVGGELPPGSVPSVTTSTVSKVMLFGGAQLVVMAFCAVRFTWRKLCKPARHQQ